MKQLRLKKFHNPVESHSEAKHLNNRSRYLSPNLSRRSDLAWGWKCHKRQLTLVWTELEHRECSSPFLSSFTSLSTHRFKLKPLRKWSVCASEDPCWHWLQWVEASLTDRPFRSACTQREESPIKVERHSLCLPADVPGFSWLPRLGPSGNDTEHLQPWNWGLLKWKLERTPILYRQLTVEGWERCWRVWSDCI